MYFENKEEVVIDGKTYTITMKSKTDIYNAKFKLYEIKELFANQFNERDFNTYMQFKKDLIKELKNFDKMYVTHIKKNGNHDFLQANIHNVAFKPLTDLLEKNYNFHQLELMINNK